MTTLHKNEIDAYIEAARLLGKLGRGAEPVLVARMQSRALDHGHFVLSLLPREGQGINLTLDETLLHSICKLIQAAVEKSEWDLKLVLPVGTGVPEAGSRTLN